MKTFLKKYGLYLLFFGLFIVPLSLHTAHAWDAIPSTTDFTGDMDAAIGPQNALSNTPVDIFMQTNHIHYGRCLLEGTEATCGKEYVKKNPGQGLIPSVTGMNVAMMINQPASTGLYLADVGHSLGFLSQAYAQEQGTGFAGLQGILSIWKVFRNIAYLLLALAIIVVGFMIMFRRKIDPKTVVTIQEALPRIIVTLILITFSYAIVALMIDLLYVVLFVTYELFRSSNLLPANVAASNLFNIGPNSGYDTQQTFLQGNLFAATGIIFPHGPGDLSNLVVKIFTLPTTSINIGSTVVGGAVGLISGGGLIGFLAGPALTGFVIPVLVQFLVGLLLAILIVRIFFLFLGAYVQLILRTIFGPLELLMGVIPGQDGFGGWFRNIAGQLSIFAVAGIMFMLATAFMIISEGTSQVLWQPPYFPGAGSTASIGALFSIGILMLIPTITNQVRQAIMTDKGKSIGVGGAIMGGFGPAIGVGLQLFNTYQTRQTTKVLRGMKNSATTGETKSAGDEHSKENKG